MIQGRLLATAVLVAGGAVLLAQQPAPSDVPLFRSRVDVIEIDLRVTDAEGRPVTDLRGNEIEVFEGGVAQQVVGFSHVSVDGGEAPPSDVPAVALPPDVVTNARQDDGRVFVLLLDDLHVDNRNGELLKAAARRFVERHLRPADLASVVYSSGRADAAQDFTSSRTLLLAAIDKFIGRKLRPATIERMEQYNQLFRGRALPLFEDVRDRADGERAFFARSALATIETVSGVLARASGRRKAMLLFSEGIDYDLSGLRSRGRTPAPLPATGSDAPAAPNAILPTGAGETAAAGRVEIHASSNDVLFSLQTAIGAAARANVALYTFDPRRGDVSDSVQDLGAPVGDPSLGLTGHHVVQEMRDAQESLWMLAENTGGFATLSASHYDDAFERVVRESSDYYLVAYSPSNTARDGTYRSISVRVKRPGLRVHARPGYYAPRSTPPAVSRFDAPGVSRETSELVMAPLPATGLRLDVQAIALRRDRRKADVVVTLQVDGRTLADAPASGATNTLEVALLALDAAGRVQAATGTALTVPLDGEAGAVLRDAGYRAISRLQVPPGRYQIRVAARERNGGRRGSVFADVEVPDFSTRLGLSGVLLASAQSERVPTAIDPATNERLPILPVVTRTFSPQDELSIVVELYAPMRNPDVDLVTTIVDASGRERYRAVNEVMRDDFRPLRGAYVHAMSIPLAELAGPVMLQVAARQAHGGDAGVSRRIAFTVTPPATQGRLRLPAGERTAP
ncbi:MAG TPA: VWA domain-containing protein [Vicinamibacterales bacterium]